MDILRITLFCHVLLATRHVRNAFLQVRPVLCVSQGISCLTVHVYNPARDSTMLTQHLKYARLVQAVATHVSTIPFV